MLDYVVNHESVVGQVMLVLKMVNGVMQLVLSHVFVKVVVEDLFRYWNVGVLAELNIWMHCLLQL